MTAFLVMQLYGPMAAWGEQAVGQVRRSAAHPSKSAVLGLCAAAMGIKREDEDQQNALATSLRFGTEVLAVGSLIKDYHTTQVPPKRTKVHHLYTRKDELAEPDLGTILSSREYRQDALFKAVLWQADGEREKLDEIADKLKQPHYHLYLGRKSCPLALPLNPKLIEVASLSDACAEYPAPLFAENVAAIRRLRNEQGSLYWEACEHSGMDESEHDMKVLRYDQPLSRKRWQFTSRDEYIRLAKAKGE